MAIFGRSDEPWSEEDKDNLRLGKYASALAEFVQFCETPMTVGIQGEWGSGKTSLMKMVQAQLKDKAGIHLHSFETWQYGAVGDDSLLGLHLLMAVTTKIMADHKKDGILAGIGSGIKSIASFLGRSVAAGAVNQVTLGAVDGGTLMGGMGAGDGPRVADLGKLKDDFRKLVAQVVGDDGEAGRSRRSLGRFILFIDDLDRIRPEHAISLLEVLKNFMDVKHCVFVVACDYEVVKLGIREKLKIQDEDKARAFFEKIIQVPFQMPVHSYAIDGLLQEFFLDKLQELGTRERRHLAAKLAKELEAMVRIATGTNPRAFKRFLNSLDLLSCVRDAPDGGAAGAQPRASVWTQDKDCRALIGLVGLQARWPRVAGYLSRATSEQMIAALASLRADLSDEDGALDEALAARIMEDTGAKDADLHEHPKVTALCSYAKLLWDLLDTDVRDGQLTENEVEPLTRWAGTLALTDIQRDATTVSGWYVFEDALKKKPGGPFAVSLAASLWDSRSAHSNLDLVRQTEKFWVQARLPRSDGMKFVTVFSITATGTGELRHNLVPAMAEKYNLPSFERIGQELHEASAKIGVEWTPRGRAMTLDLADLAHAKADVLGQLRGLIARSAHQVSAAASSVVPELPAPAPEPGLDSDA